jgi:hypothetical protein
MRAAIRQASPFLVDVALAVIDDSDHGGLSERRFRLLSAFEPAIGFLLLDRQGLVIGGFAFGSTPHLRIEQSEAFLRARVHRQDRMHEQPDIAAVADRSQAALTAALRLIVDLAGVLDREHMPARRSCAGQHRPMRHHLLHRDRLVGQESPELHLLRAIVRELAYRDRLTLAHALQNHGAIFFNRTSPKYPISMSAIAPSCESRRQQQNHAGFQLGKCAGAMAGASVPI